ncbi:MAG: hypothetical protein OXK77_00060 [Gemmatimonadota bacterium]|nr:hypothetical protein [Gemmatimonadota bacterium]MDE2865302.1 hypothetical protein [Gemmatimonadota bacterium]
MNTSVSPVTWPASFASTPFQVLIPVSLSQFLLSSHAGPPVAWYSFTSTSRSGVVGTHRAGSRCLDAIPSNQASRDGGTHSPVPSNQNTSSWRLAKVGGMGPDRFVFRTEKYLSPVIPPISAGRRPSSAL